MHFLHFMMKKTKTNLVEVLILRLKMECLRFGTASLRSMQGVNYRKGLNSVQIFLYQGEALI